MENEAYSEYFKLKRNKVSLAMWVLINNNLVTKNIFLFFMGVDFILQVMIILCLYSQVGAVPVISTQLIDAFDYSDVHIIAVVAISQGAILTVTFSFLLILVFKDLSWQIYSEKKLLFQIESALIIIFRSPLLILSLLFILHSLYSFTEIENAYLRYLSAIFSIMSAAIIFVYCYIGSYLFNLCIPNEQLPWADTSHQPYLLQTLFKMLLVLTFKMRYYSAGLIYSMAVATTLICGYRIYLLLLKSHMFDDTVYRVSILFDFGIIHLMIFFILTAVNQGQDYYLLFVAFFMPVTCMSGFFVKERCKRVWLSQLMNDNMNTEGDQLLCFLYLIFLYTEENEDAWQQLIRLQQIHYTRCEGYFNSIEKKMYTMLKDARANGPIQYKSGGGGFGMHEITDGIDEIIQDSQVGDEIYEVSNDRSSQYQKSMGVASFTNKKVANPHGSINSQGFNQLNAYNEGNTVAQKQRIQKAPKTKQSKTSVITRTSRKDLKNYIYGMGPSQIVQEEEKEHEVGTPQALNPRSQILEGPDKKNTFRNQIEIQQENDDGKQYKLIDEVTIPVTEDRSSISKISPRRMSEYPIMKVSSKKMGEGKGQPKMKHMGQSKLIQTAVSMNNISDIFSSSHGGTTTSKSFRQPSKSTFQAKIFDMEIKKGQLRKLVKHYFNGHLLDDTEMGFQLKLVKIYFTYKILKNPYLAHFLLFSYQEDENADNNFIVANQRLLNQRYIDDLISIRQLQLEESNRSLLGQVNLLELLKVNQLLVEFDTSLERISSEILDFWENLLNQKETIQIFTQGLKISDQIKYIQKLIVEITEKQSDSESKIYLQMANFYSQVVFKSFESFQMLDKARIAIQVKKLSKMSQERSGGESGGNSGQNSDNQEKCLLMAHISLKKPMKITFINKAALKLLQYTLNEALSLSINSLMPKEISDQHQFFLDSFMLTGKTRMLKTKRELFIKQSSGTVVPVFTYLFVNNMSRKHMILMFEPNFNLKLFEEPYQNVPSSFLLANKDFSLTEISNSFDRITGITNENMLQYSDDLDRQLHCDDFIKTVQADFEISQVMDMHDNGEIDIYFKGVRQYFQVNESISMEGNTQNSFNMSSILPQGLVDNAMSLEKMVNSGLLNQSSTNNASFFMGTGKQLAMQDSINLEDIGVMPLAVEKDKKELAKKGEVFSVLLTPVFVMRIIEQPYIDGKFHIKLLAFRRKNGVFIKPNGEIFSQYSFRDVPTYGEHLNVGSGPANLQRPTITNGESNENVSRTGGDGFVNTSQEVQINQFNQLMMEESQDEQFNELASISSTGSFSSQSATVSVFTTYTQQVNSNVTPKTLRFILNMVLIIIGVMLVASSLVLSISLENLSRAEISIEVCKHSFQAIDEMTTIRLLLRSLSNIYQGYQLKEGQYLKDRQTHYEGLILDLNENMRDDANFVAQMADGQMSQYSQNIQCGFLSATAKDFIMNQSLSQGVNLLVSKVQDVIKAPERVQVIKDSKLPFINFNSLQNKNYSKQEKVAVQTERDVYFVLNNTNGDLHYQLKTFGKVFSDVKIEEINSNMLYLSGMSLGVISIILMSGFVVIPLFGKIQNRILELMKLFFAIDITIKKSIISRIEEFLKAYYKTNNAKRFGGARRLRTNMFGNFQKGNRYSIDEEDVDGDPQPVVIQPGKVEKVVGFNKSSDKKSGNQKNGKKSKFGKINQAFGIAGSNQKRYQLNVENLERIKEEEERKSDDDQMGKSKVRKGSLFVKAFASSKKDKKEHHHKKKKTKGEDFDAADDLGIKGDFSSSVKGREKSKKGEKNKHNDDNIEDLTYDSNDDSKSKHDEEEEREAAEKLKLDEMQKAKLEAILNKEREVIIEFSKYTNKRKVVQALFIVGLLSVMASYFLIKYLLSLSLFEKMKTSVVDLETIFGRLACSQNVLNTYVESYFSSDIIQSVNPDFMSLNSRIDYCMEIERNYQKSIMNNPVSYLDDAVPFINLIEKGQLCDGFANISMSYDQCLQISEQIRKQGLATYYFNIMKSIKQLELDLTSSVKNTGTLSRELVQEQLNLKIATYVDTLILVVLPSQSNIQSKSLKSISDYFSNQSTILSIIYAAYLSITILLAVFFVFSMYIKLRKEMLASNRLLYIIDFESLQEAERQIILKFLLNY